MSSEEIEKLQAEVARLEKIRLSLMKRVKNSLSDKKDAFGLFEGNIFLEQQVKERTDTLREMANELAGEKTKLAQLIKALPGDVIIFNKNLEVEKFVKGKYSKQERSIFSDNLLESFGKEFGRRIRVAVGKASGEDSFATFDFLHKKSEKEEVYYYCGVSNLDNDQNVLYLQENTEKYLQEKLIREQELQLVESSRLSALGEMAGGVAHEINTPLGAILLAAGQLKKNLSADGDVNIEKAAKFTDLIINTVNRVGNIVKSLRQVSRDGTSDELEICMLSDIVEDSLGLCRERFAAKGISLELEGDVNIPVFAKRIQLSQVILNLLNNSFHVAQEKEKGWIKLRCEEFQDSCRIYVIDCGEGIEEEVLEKVFQPFFTTKDVGEGTGLGMSVSQQIVRDHNGELKYALVDGHTAFYFDVQRCKQQISA
ncbi:MAG: sensor histidine kinase [Bdellovibrionales bacterium]